MFVSTLVLHSIISSAEILTPQLGTVLLIGGAGEALRSYSNNPAVNTISVSQGEFYGSPSTMRKAEKNEKSFNLAPWGNIDLEAIEGIRQGDHYRVLGCWVNTGRKMAPCYFKTKLIAVNDAGRH